MKILTTVQRRLIIGLLVIAAVGAASFITINRKQDLAVASPPDRIVQPVDKMLPSVNNKTLESKKIEYLPSTDPQLNEAYCVHRYTDDTYIYQYIGNTGRSNPKLRC